METGINSYLHKKFKKQLSIDARQIKNDVNNKEKKINTIIATIEERTTTTNTTTTTPTTLENCNKININENLCRKLNDNTNLVPNISTNVSNVHTIVTNNYKSSISLDNTNNISCYVPNIQQQYDVNLYGKKSSILYKYEGEQQKDEIQHQQQQQLQQKQQLPDKSITGNGKYICTYCNLACSKPSVLQKHIRAHTNERPYPCVSCGFSFKTRSNLYKHCRSRTHANRLLGNKARGELNDDLDNVNETTTTIITTPTTNTTTTITEIQHQQQPPTATKLYKPRFHTIFYEKNINIKENIEEDKDNHINDITNETYLKKNQTTSLLPLTTSTTFEEKLDEPLNLTNKRKRCISDAVESKSLIKELLLQNLSSDMQCEHCKMLFQTVTELELHKIRSCKGMIKLGEKYTRSNSVNVASILIQNNKNNNQFDTIQLKSPGPFLGKTRLIDSDKNKSFSFDDGLSNITKYPSTPIITSTTTFKLNSNLNDDKKQKIKLFGGQVKIQENKSNLENKLNDYDKEYLNYGGCLDQTLNNRMNENRVIKSSLQSGGTVLTNKNNYDINTNNTIKVQHTNSPFSYDIDEKKKINNDDINKYTNIIDFSQNAAKLLTPNIKQPNLLIPGLPIPNYQQNNIKNITQPLKIEIDEKINESHTNIFNPMNLLVNGKIVRYVPGMPGPIIAETPPQSNEIKTQTSVITTPTPTTTTIITTKEISPRSPVIKLNEIKKSPLIIENKKFQRPNSLALKPTSTILKQHHGLTPTMFNQILISPDTPRISKKYVQQYLNGNYFSYLGLKSTTKSVYCTLNKTQPSYVPHYKKLSMYSEWRQQDRKNDKLYVAGYDSRQKSRRYTIAGQKRNDLTTHSSYKFTSVEIKDKQNNQQKLNQILGGYECNDDYTYIRGRGRGRYVCEQCGIRCKKPSMLKKHIRTHSNDRPYTCSHCNFSFKTKGNLTKHMKSKAHNKNSTTSSSSSSTQQSSTPSSESDTEDSGMDSSDESTRQQEHEAAYGLLSLSQKSTQNFTTKTTTISNETNRIMNIDEINYVTKTNYAKNKCLEQPNIKLNNIKDITQIIDDVVDDDEDDDEDVNDTKFLGNFHENRPLTYPYYMSNDIQDEPISVSSDNNDDNKSPENIQNFQVIQRYQTEDKKNERTGVIVTKNTLNQDLTLRKRKYSNENDSLIKLYKNDEEIEEDDEVIDLSFNTTQKSNGSINYQQNDDSNGFILINQLETNVIKKISSSLSSSPKNYKEFDNNLETLADIATKQVKLEKNAMAKSVASEYLKLTTKQEYQNENERYPITKDVNDLIVKSEGNKCCTICSKSFNKPSQLRLHMNVHYLERPYRCDSCSVSFRTKGHLQKHERSASHHNKLSSSPALSSSEPRPFKCTDCNIAFRIHGHLAKHLRSKMHIMKLECLAKIPFGLYAELERSNSLLTEINTSDGDQCLESLRLLAKKVFINEGRQLKNLDTTDLLETD